MTVTEPTVSPETPGQKVTAKKKFPHTCKKNQAGRATDSVDKEKTLAYTLDLTDRLSLALEQDEPPLPDEKDVGPLYRFRADNMTLPDALALFAKTYQLNIIVDPDVVGAVNVNFRDLPLKNAMEAILDIHGCYWEEDEGLIRVHLMETRTFSIDYIRLKRSGKGSSQATVSSGTSSSSGESAGSIHLGEEDEISFWEEFGDQLESLMSDEGLLVINKLSGTIQITDRHRNIVTIESYINAVGAALHRQVEIEVKIVEVTLTDDSSLGIDWSRVDLGNAILSASASVSNPVGGTSAKTATLNIAYSGDDLDAVLNALKEQGQVKVVSQPRIRTLNNQPAMIKVGTEQSFFILESEEDEDTGDRTVTETRNTVTVGVVLSITPQISEDDWVILNVVPIITRLVDKVESPLGSTAPVLDVKQSSTLIRCRNGEMAVLGGLIQDELSDTERKVPFLGDLFLVGTLFKGTYNSKVKRELVVFLAPRIIED